MKHSRVKEGTCKLVFSIRVSYRHPLWTAMAFPHSQPTDNHLLANLIHIDFKSMQNDLMPQQMVVYL